MDSEELRCTPPELAEKAQNVTSNLLPAKSKHIYTNTYKEFLDWCNKKNVINYTENVFIAYFSEKNSIWKATTLWSHYSMLKTCFNIYKNIYINKFAKLITFLKRSSENYKPKKSKIFTLEELNRFIYEAPDNKFLMMKVNKKINFTYYYYSIK